MLHGIYSVTIEGGDATTPPSDVGIVIEGVEVLHDLGDIVTACARLMGVKYALNLSYPQEMKSLFEVLQKIFLQLDASRLSTKGPEGSVVPGCYGGFPSKAAPLIRSPDQKYLKSHEKVNKM